MGLCTQGWRTRCKAATTICSTYDVIALPRHPHGLRVEPYLGVVYVRLTTPLLTPGRLVQRKRTSLLDAVSNSWTPVRYSTLKSLAARMDVKCNLKIKFEDSRQLQDERLSVVMGNPPAVGGAQEEPAGLTCNVDNWPQLLADVPPKWHMYYCARGALF